MSLRVKGVIQMLNICPFLQALVVELMLKNTLSQ